MPDSNSVQEAANNVSSGIQAGVQAIAKGQSSNKQSSNNKQNTENKLEDFVNKALSYKGYSASKWASKHSKWYHSHAWCADFVSACAEEVGGILGKVFDGNPSAYGCAHSVTKYGGKIHYEKTYTPQRGDLVNFIWGGGGNPRSEADHIGIVTGFSNNTVHTIEGNSSNSVRQKTYSRNSNSLACFCSPNWSKVGGFATGANGTITGSLFQETNTRQDATLREAAYFKEEYKNKKIEKYIPTEKATNIRLSIINYTDLFQAYWDVGAPSMGIVGSYDYSKLDPKVRAVVKALVDRDFNNAAACGIAGNIKDDSNFDTGKISKDKKSVGLCQWEGTRGDSMKDFVGSDWSTNISGQVDFIIYELGNKYKSVLDSLKRVSNTADGVKQAADIFVKNYEKRKNANSLTNNRQKNASDYFSNITQVIVNTSSSSSGQFASVDLSNVSQDRKAIVQRAQNELGKPYIWGAVGPKGYDCSGLVSYCLTGKHSRIGTTSTFRSWPTANPPQPGDVCSASSHCGIFIGDGKMIHAPHTGDVVKVAKVRDNMKIVVYRR